MSSGKPEQVESHGALPGPPAPGHEPDGFEWAEKAGIENRQAQDGGMARAASQRHVHGASRVVSELPDAWTAWRQETQRGPIGAGESLRPCQQLAPASALYPTAYTGAAIRRHQGRRERNSAKRPRQCLLSQLEDDRPAIGKRRGGLFVCAHGPRARLTSSQRVAARHPHGVNQARPGSLEGSRKIAVNVGLHCKVTSSAP